VAVLHSSGTHYGTGSIANDIAKAGTGNVLITTYATLRLKQDQLLGHKWHYVVLDEGHKIRNPDAEVTLAAKQLQTQHRLVLTGSPIQNNLRELWSLFDFIFPGKLGTLPVFMTEFSVPMTQGSYVDASEVQVQVAYQCAIALRDTIRPYLLRRSKKDVMSQIKLPGRTEQVLFCKLSPDQRLLYRRYIESPEVQSVCAGDLRTFVAIDTLRKVCNHPDLATKLSDPPDYTNPEVPLPYERSGKMKVLRQLLELWKEGKHKVLVFSQTRQMLSILESFVASEGYGVLAFEPLGW
jgi:DNA excision repair protein ERCC-6